MYNIIEDYITLQKKHIDEYMKLILGEFYDKNIINKFIKRYIGVRYLNNDAVEEHKFFYRRIYGELIDESKILKDNFPKMSEKIEKTLPIFQYIFYLDDVRTINNLDEFINSICARETKMFGKKNCESFKNELNKLIKAYSNENRKFFSTYDTQDFELVVSKYTLAKGIYSVNLKRKFKISYIYSSQVINEVFNEKLIYEDKLMIEYLMTSVKCLKDILNGDFDIKYILDFPISVLKKEQKLNQMLRIIESQPMQEKMILRISYKDFILNKDKIYDIISKGYKFAIALDETFEVTDDRMKLLDIFEYILINPKFKDKEEVYKYKDKRDNFLIDEIKNEV